MNPMNTAWFVLKGSRDKAVMPFDVGSGAGGDKGRSRRMQVPTVGGTAADMRQGLSGDAPISEDTSAMDDLASATRQDLINMLLAKVQEMSDDDILNILRNTEG